MFLCLVCLHLNLRAQPSVTDADGNTYSTLTIGSQVWMAGNLRTTRYRNGDPIRNVRDNKVWESLPTGAFCVYGHNVEHAETYGALYNWHAVVDKRGLAPEGWHIPTKAEWEVLFQFLSDNGYGYEGSGSDIAFSLAANQGWSRAGKDGAIGTKIKQNNRSGFSALPGGTRNPGGTFVNKGAYGYWWTGNDVSDETALAVGLYNNAQWPALIESRKTCGYSVRCIKDTE